MDVIRNSVDQESATHYRARGCTTEATYVFPVSVTLGPTLPTSAKIVLTVNTYENFRWQDQSGGGYQTGVFDTTATTYETVESFGANSFTLGVE